MCVCVCVCVYGTDRDGHGVVLCLCLRLCLRLRLRLCLRLRLRLSLCLCLCLCTEEALAHPRHPPQDILNTGRSKTHLLVSPKKYGNLARFINGSRFKRDCNVLSLRCMVRGMPKVLLYAGAKGVKKGQWLRYDYNGGLDASVGRGYDTQGFV